MSRYLKIALAALAALALATPAFAVTGDVSGFYQVKGFAWDNANDGDDDLDDNGRAIDARARLFINGALNENVKMVTGFEFDTVYGRAANENAGKQIGTMGTDAKGQLEIKHLYLDFTVPEISTNFKLGSQYFKLGRGLIIADDAAGVFVRSACPMLPNNSLGLFWIKPSEGSEFDDSADSDYYHLQYDMKFGDIAIAPYVGYFDMAEDDDAWFGGIDFDGKFAGLGLSATAIANSWDTDDANGLDGESFALWGKGTYKLGGTLLSLEAAWYGDEDNVNGEFFNLSQGGATGMYNNFAEIVTGGRFDTRSSISANQKITAKNGAVAPYYANYWYAKLGAEQKFGDKHKVSGYYVYAEEAEDEDARDAITFGHEIDAYYDYTIMKGLTFFAGGGYLIADDDFGAGDDAWKVGTSILYQF